MRKVSILTVALMIVLVFTAPSNAAPQLGRAERDRVCFYQDIHYQGLEDCYSPGDEVAKLRDRKNNFSSIRIFGRARVTVYDEEEFRGPAAEFTADVPDLGRRSLSGSRSWSDRIESFRIGSGFNTPLPRNDDRGQNQGRGTLREGICVYEGPNFQGRSECFESGVELRDLGRISNWNDRITSIRVIGRARAIFYRDIGLRGERLAVDRDIADLRVFQLRGASNWSRQISSLEVDSDRGYGNGNGNGMRGRPRY